MATSRKEAGGRNTKYHEQIEYFHLIRQKKGFEFIPELKPKSLATFKKAMFFSFIIKGLSNTVGFTLSVYIIGGLIKLIRFAAVMNCISIAIDVLNFLKTPLLFLMAKYLGIEKKLTISKTGRWIYSTLVLNLGITALVLPQAGPVMLIVLMTLAVLDAIFLLTKVFYTRHQEQLNSLEQKMQYIKLHNKLFLLEAKILNLIEKDKPLEKIHHSINKYQIYLERIKKISILYCKSKQKLGKNDAVLIIDKVFILSLSLIGLTASLLLLYMPTMGLSLFALTSGSAVLYLVSRLLIEILLPPQSIKFEEEVVALSIEAGQVLKKGVLKKTADTLFGEVKMEALTEQDAYSPYPLFNPLFTIAKRSQPKDDVQIEMHILDNRFLDTMK